MPTRSDIRTRSSVLASTVKISVCLLMTLLLHNLTVVKLLLLLISVSIFWCIYIISRCLSTLVRAYCIYVRRILEYNCVVWSLSNQCDIREVESVQRQLTKRLNTWSQRLQLFSYWKNVESWHTWVKTTSLWPYHVLQNCFSIIRLEFVDFFSFIPVTVTQRHPYRLFVPFTRKSTRKNFFAHRVVKP